MGGTALQIAVLCGVNPFTNPAQRPQIQLPNNAQTPANKEPQQREKNITNKKKIKKNFSRTQLNTQPPPMRTAGRKKNGLRFVTFTSDFAEKKNTL